MKRRDFLLGSAGLVGAMAPVLVRGQSRPCPQPTLSVNSGPPVSTTCNPLSTLEQACTALSQGQSAAFPQGQQTAFSQADMEWQSCFQHDDLHGIVHLMGKQANAPTEWRHQWYTVATGAWTSPSNEFNMWNNPGHVYCNFALDFTTGDLYQGRQGMGSTSGYDHQRQIPWRQFANGAPWAYSPVSGAMYSGAMDDIWNGIAYHPNLYGSGKGGWVADSATATYLWNKATDVVTRIAHNSQQWGDWGGGGLYWPAYDIAIFGGEGGSPLAKAVGGASPAISSVGAPPIEVRGYSRIDGGTFGSLHVHPGNPNKLILISTTDTSYYTATYSGGSLVWSGNLGPHPFTADTSDTGYARVTCSLRAQLGCLWALATNSGGSQYSMLWKPAP